MIVLCTGTSGSGQIEYLNKMAKLVKKTQDKPRVYDLGDKMQEIAREQGHTIPEEKVLDVGIVQEFLSAWAFERIKNDILSASDSPVHIVVAHACFRRRNVLFMGLNVACVKRLNPDMIVTIIDDISAVQRRLSRRELWARWCEAADLSCWREEEILVSQILARYQEVDYNVVPQAEPPSTLYNLVYNPAMKKIYLSFPISNIIELEDEQKRERYLEQVEKLRDALRKNFIVFDPLSIKDLQLIPSSMEESDKQALAGQTVERDYMLIDQSDVVVGYYPVMERSLGVAAEMRYSKQFGKPVHAVIDEDSPFLREFVDHVYRSPDDMVNALLKQFKKGRES